MTNTKHGFAGQSLIFLSSLFDQVSELKIEPSEFVKQKRFTRSQFGISKDSDNPVIAFRQRLINLPDLAETHMARHVVRGTEWHVRGGL